MIGPVSSYNSSAVQQVQNQSQSQSTNKKDNNPPLDTQDKVALSGAQDVDHDGDSH